jgi:hypothetical protein
MASIGDINKMHVLTEILPPATKRPVGRIKINDEQTPARFPEGTLARIDAVLKPKEKRSDFIREAVERELKRRAKPKS